MSQESSPEASPLTVKWLPANQAYCVVMEDRMLRVGGRVLFESRDDLRQTLSTLGLRLRKNEIVLDGGPNPFAPWGEPEHGREENGMEMQR